jgi:hypothetical protein
VFAAIEEQSGPAKKRHACQMNFYGGIWALRQDAKEEAVRLLNLAANECYQSSLEWSAARAEIKALDVPPSVTSAATPSAAPAEQPPKEQ